MASRCGRNLVALPQPSENHGLHARLASTQIVCSFEIAMFPQLALRILRTTDPRCLGKFMWNFGVKGIRCDRKEDVMRVTEEMINHPGPCVVDYHCEMNEHVYPMVASGKALHEMELGVVGQVAPQTNTARELGTLA